MSFLELSLRLKGFPLQEAEKELSSIKKLPESEFNTWHENKKWQIVKYHFENNEFYRSRFDGDKIPDRWEEIPLLVKTDYQNSGYDLISKTFDKKNIYSGYTSGSSGHPFNYYKDKFAHAMTWALIKDRYRNFGLTLDSRQARFYGIPLERKDYYIEKAKDFLSNRVRFPVFDLSDGMLAEFLKKFRSEKFDYVYGYTNSIVLFARYLIRINVILKDVCPGLKICICTSENCTEEDKAVIEKGFGVKAVNEYGTSEVDLIAFETEAGKWLLSEENIFIEVIDDIGNPVTNGGEGRILLTALHNKAMPFIRYEIGDKAIIAPGQGKIELKRILGGVNDIVILPSGKKSSGVSFYFITRSTMEKIDSLKEFIIRQVSPDKFIFDVVSDEEISDNAKKMIQKNLDTYLESGLSFEINRVEKIKRTKAGKMKHFYSELDMSEKEGSEKS
ncbi:MAG TPA: phenylacetate--CoA ligase family protein [Ignavibacteria bacterium]|nr:phenylacetate--CoA ligase family protein [Ignavibacteria bacterium]HMR38800.1 phenylacetate--CoA ligase family protein [Ignavibacteria bacterium]